MSENNPFLFHVTDVSYELSRTRELNIDGLSPLYGELDAGASEDENLLVSIGDIAHTSGGYFSLYFLPETADPRTVLRMVFPTIKRGVRQTADSRVHFAMDALEKWISGDDSVDLRKFQPSLEEATQAVPAMFFHHMNVDNLALDARNRAIVAAESINEAIDFAIGKLAAPDESSDDDQGYVYEANPPKLAKAYRIARQLIEYAVDQGEADIALAQDILAISPLHAVAA